MVIQISLQSKRKHILGLLILPMLFLASCIVKFDGRNATNQPQAPHDETPAYTPVDLVTPVDTVPPINTSSSDPNAARPVIGRIFYVSKDGSNSDAESWGTAWNEIDQIQWEKIRPGDRIILAGGEYHTSMNVGKSGLPGAPITITTNGEQVVFDGQRPAPPYCGETGYVSTIDQDGINLEGESYIIIDGQNWRGFIIRKHIRGIMLRNGASNITVRNVEIYDNGWFVNSGSSSNPDGPGVELGGSDILFERVIIHDNGQDAFQAGWGIRNFTLRNSWLYNSRENPIEPGKPFNDCSHTDGIQIYDGGVQGPVVIESSIIGPSFTQGIMINNRATVKDVLIKNTLFVSNGNAGIAIQNGGDSSNWTLQNVTVVQDASYESWNIKMRGSNHHIRDSVFWGGSWGIGIYNSSEASNNYRWNTRDPYSVSIELDPMFVDDTFSRYQGSDFADFNFQIQNPAIPPGTGSSITTVDQLFTSE